MVGSSLAHGELLDVPEVDVGLFVVSVVCVEVGWLVGIICVEVGWLVVSAICVEAVPELIEPDGAGVAGAVVVVVGVAVAAPTTLGGAVWLQVWQ